MILGSVVFDDFQARFEHRGGTDLQSVLDDLVDVDAFPIQTQHTALNARDVEEVVEQLGLEELDVTPNHLEVLAHLRRHFRFLEE